MNTALLLLPDFALILLGAGTSLNPSQALVANTDVRETVARVEAARPRLGWVVRSDRRGDKRICDDIGSTGRGELQ